MNRNVKDKRLMAKGLLTVALGILFLTPVLAQELLNWPLDTINGEEVYRYEVERSIGLYRIGVNFNVPQSEIIRLNPQLNERGLHYGETLLIPTGRKVNRQQAKEPEVSETKLSIQAAVAAVAKGQQPDSITIAVVPVIPVVLPDTIIPEDTVIGASPATNYAVRTIELALMLPFESQQTKRSSNADRMLEFYQGALLALNDLQNDSTRFRIRVFDTERSERRINALCDSSVLNHVQGIIGPVYPIQIERMANWCLQHEVPLLLPFSADNQMERKPYALQFNSPDKQQADSLCAWLKHRDDVHLVAVEVKEADMTEYARVMRKQMQVHQIPYSAVHVRDLLNDSADYALDPEKENIILLHSDKFQHVRMLMPHIEKWQTDGYSIRIIGQYSWLKENIAVPQVYASMFTSNASHEAYDTQWDTFFRSEHASDTPRYDLLGYDLIQTLVAWLQGENVHHGIQSDIRWVQVKDGGFQNKNVRIVVN